MSGNTGVCNEYVSYVDSIFWTGCVHGTALQLCIRLCRKA